MKKTVLLAFLLTMLCSVTSRAQAYWGNKSGGVTIEEGLGVVTDASGNTYTTGYFTNTCIFGAGNSLSTTGLSDIFVAKYDPTGNLLWAKKFGGVNDERAKAIALDNTGNIYVTGQFSTSTVIGSVSLASAGQDDALLFKLDNNGNFLWAQSGGGAGADLGYDVATDQLGNVIITGQIRNTATFGSFVLNGTEEDVFIMKYNSAGVAQWSQLGTAKFIDRGLGIACDNNNNIYVIGQFSDTITFDQPHNNNANNVSFLVKFDANGNELWFRGMGGGLMCTAYDLDASGNNVYVTGDFAGAMNFYGVAAPPLTNTYTNRIFLASFSGSGGLNWAQADGSNSDVSARAVEVNNDGVFIGGQFKCTFNEYADVYGQGTFNSVGYSDCFIAKYSISGQRDWMRSWGGKKNDFCWDLAVEPTGEPVAIGNFEDELNVPITAAMLANMHQMTSPICTAFTQINSYCSDPEYNNYYTFANAGNYDVFVGRMINPAREPYDFYQRFSTGCLRPQVEPCLEGSFSAYDCPDTAFFCGPQTLELNTYASPLSCVGPDYTYQYAPSTVAVVNGIYSVTTTRVDGCYTWTDSIYVRIMPLPPPPPISDEIPVNTDAVITTSVRVCADSLEVWSIDGYPSYSWNGGQPMDTSLTITQSGTYFYTVTDTNGCVRSNTIYVILDDSLPALNLASICPPDLDQDDTIQICQGVTLWFDIYDTVTNLNMFTDWTGTWELYTPSGGPFTNNIGQVFDATFVPTVTGWYVADMSPMQRNYCDTIIHNIIDSIYVIVNPLPPITLTLSPPNLTVCDGDTVVMIAATSPPGLPVTWTNDPQIVTVSGDTALVMAPAMISASATYVDSLGCQNTVYGNAILSAPASPVISSNPDPAIICFNDSIQLTCAAAGSVVSYQWYGPQGTIGGNSNTVYALNAGFYYCAVFDTNGCYLYSNTIEVIQFGTPYLIIQPDPMICPGGQDSVNIVIAAAENSTIQWLPPLSGSDTIQVVNQGGIYSCEVTTCGITQTISIVVNEADLSISIAATGDLIFCEGDSVFLSATVSDSIQSVSWNPGGATTAFIWTGESGSYTATGTDNYGCTVTSNAIVVQSNINNVPLPDVVNVEFCSPGYASLTVGGTGFIKWFAHPDSLTPFHTGPTYNTPLLNESVTYYVLQEQDSCVGQLTEIQAIVVDCDTLIIPNVFTPNGDGINDLVGFDLTGTTCFNCEILNRWGTTVFKTTDINTPWTGHTQEGRPLAEGVYYYVIDYCPYIGPQQTLTGFIHLFY